MAPADPLSMLIEKLEFCKCKKCKKVTSLNVLPCLHSFCDGCIGAPGRRVRACPACRVVVPTEPPANGFVSFLIDMKSLRVVKLCHLCQADDEKTNATHVCLSCSDEPRYLCRRCKRHHDMFPGGSSHRVVTVAEFAENGGNYRPADSHKFCDLHIKEPIKLACQSCLKMMCMICVAVSDCLDSSSSDKRHLCDELRLTVNKCKKEISGSMADGSEGEKEVRKQVEEVKKERESTTLPGYQSMWDSVKARYDAASIALADERDTALESIDTSTGGRLTKTDAWLKQADEYLRKLNGCYYEGEQALMYSPPAEVLDVTRTLRETLQLKPSLLVLQPMPELKHTHKCTNEEIGALVRQLVGRTSRAIMVGDIVRLSPCVTYGDYQTSHRGNAVSSFKLSKGKVATVSPYNGKHSSSGKNHIGQQYTVKFPAGASHWIDTEVELVL